MEAVGRFHTSRGYQSVSEAIRDLRRYAFLKTNVAAAKNELCIARVIAAPTYIESFVLRDNL